MRAATWRGPDRTRQAFACFALITLGLLLWARHEVLAAGGGRVGVPLDDSYIHFQFARSFASFQPFQYSPGQPPVPGATSLLWPGLLAPALWLGASGSGLIALSWCLGFAGLFGQACEVLLAARRFLSLPMAFAAGLLVLSLSANTWFAASGMEVLPLGYLLLRSARRSAEYVDGARSRARAVELVLLGAAAVLLRPEGALAALMIAVAFAWGGGRYRLLALLALGLPLLVPLLSWLFTGSPAQTTTLAKWLPFNPYYRAVLPAAIGERVRLFFVTLLNGEAWAWPFVPEGYSWLGLASLPALWLAARRRQAHAHAALLCVLGLGVLIPTSYETFLVNRLRYLWPFAGPWLLGLAALGELLGQLLSRASTQLRPLALLVPATCLVGFGALLPPAIGDVAQSAAAITAQQVSLGEWAKTALPPGAKVGVNDAGAIAFYSGHPTFDIVGLTTRDEARYWVAGPGSRFEHYEKLKRAELPAYFIVYPEWFGIPDLLGECLTERVVSGATILGGPRMVACLADYASLGSGAKPSQPLGERQLLDELDVADLESEAAHGYRLGSASQQQNLVVTSAGISDGGRAERSLEELELVVEGSGLLIVRLSSTAPTELGISIAGRPALTLPVSAAELQEVSFSLPAGMKRGLARVSLRSSAPIAVLHYWSYAVL